jgi:hypothetical protein
VGGRGASINLKDGKSTVNVGVPGTCLSYRTKLDDADTAKINPVPVAVPSNSRSLSGATTAILVLALIVIGYVIGKIT